MQGGYQRPAALSARVLVAMGPHPQDWTGTALPSIGAGASLPQNPLMAASKPSPGGEV
jgi:hypothetical protein